jgi:hypothetical protein
VTYNEHGDQIQEVCEHEGRDFGIDDEGRLTATPPPNMQMTIKETLDWYARYLGPVK